ncbi:MAG: TIGR00282 family metallophosphoesterase [Magnetococcales bacterium]|nr:TIGR00282 family metallophosphoesterase [Magnetococcales bacterium]MBF0148586.1 TIGR00282 family metallophosphoesterase [Magnetococcales bacterium]MBF0172284.1 TIGR00282 family metallophosphoesterase [Magnetococcales bacterium]MBF0347315.1 TIGR00282 family metallophosphoesterase [Magnetococcales bacterium]MBF0629721.1 TIGR00282 family metallophosphoesterase [Magnetococcales bacterium]
MSSREVILFIGDLFGKSGRSMLKKHLAEIKKRYAVTAVVANCENAAGGIGVTAAIARELLLQGVDVLTSGNHIWRYNEINRFLEEEKRLLRPLNYPPGAPGHGMIVVELDMGFKLGVINLQGRVFMDPLDCPFRAVDQCLTRMSLGRDPHAILVDFHAEATSEKAAMGYHLDGRVTAVLGTHTHVPTADARILPRGTGFMTDVGMTGAYDSIIGMETRSVMPRFLRGLPTRFEPETSEGTLAAVVVEVDRSSGRCLKLTPILEGGGWPMHHAPS